jgi:hypothetical protein
MTSHTSGGGLLQAPTHFVQAAIFIDSANTRSCAAAAVAEPTDRARLLAYILMHFGIDEFGRSERFTLAQAQGLEPYLDDLGERGLSQLWSECNKRGWFTWRREHLDHRVEQSKQWRVSFDLVSRRQLLDTLLGEVTYWPDLVIDHRFIQIGYSREEAFDIIARWATAKGSTEAVTPRVVSLPRGRRGGCFLFSIACWTKPEINHRCATTFILQSCDVL